MKHQSESRKRIRNSNPWEIIPTLQVHEEILIRRTFPPPFHGRVHASPTCRHPGWTRAGGGRVGFLRRSMRSDPRNDRCAPFAKNRLVSGERTNRSYRVVPPRYSGTLFAASLLSLSSLSSKTHAVHTHTHTDTHGARCLIISRRDCYSLNIVKGVVLERSSSSYFYIARYILRSGYQEFLTQPSGSLSTPSDPILTSSFSPFPSGGWLHQPAVYRACTCSVSSLRVTRFRQSDGLHPWVQICYVYPVGVRRVSNGFAVIPTCWIGCSAGRSISVGKSWNQRFRVSTIRLEYRVLTGQPRPRTVQETVLHDLYATCCLKIRVILVGELCVGRERRIYPRYSDPTNVVRELLSRVSFASSFDSSLGWQVDRIYLAGLRTGI